MRLVYAAEALADLEGILEFISIDNPSAALRFGDELLETCRLFEKNPELGMARKDLAPGLRQFAHRGCSIYYRIEQEDDVVRVARILHAALDEGQASFQ